MLNHITLRVSNLEKSKQFFLAVLAPLGYKLFVEKPTSAGFGQADREGNRDFWIKQFELGDIKSFSCLAFTATSKEMVEEFYKAALATGAKDNGAPGYRPQYHPGYYAAFVTDPDGYNIEAVWDDIEKLKAEESLAELKRATLIASTGASVRLAGSEVTDEEVEQISKSSGQK